MIDSQKTAQELYDILLRFDNRLRHRVDLYNDYPETQDVEFDSRTLYELSRIGKIEDFSNRGYIFSNYLDMLLQKAIDNGETDFELQANWPMGPFPMSIKARDDKRVKLVIVGNLGEQALKEMKNIDVLVLGSTGDDVLLFSKNCRALVTRSVGNLPLLQTEDCVLDAETMGYNPLMAKNGRIVLRGEPPKRLHDAKVLIKYLDGAAPLIGKVSHIQIYFRAKSMIESVIKADNLKLQSAIKGSKYFEYILYSEPDWIPKRIYSGIGIYSASQPRQ